MGGSGGGRGSGQKWSDSGCVWKAELPRLADGWHVGVRGRAAGGGPDGSACAPGQPELPPGEVGCLGAGGRHSGAWWDVTFQMPCRPGSGPAEQAYSGQKSGAPGEVRLAVSPQRWSLKPQKWEFPGGPVAKAPSGPVSGGPWPFLQLGPSVLPPGPALSDWSHTERTGGLASGPSTSWSHLVFPG